MYNLPVAIWQIYQEDDCSSEFNDLSLHFVNFADPLITLLWSQICSISLLFHCCYCFFFCFFIFKICIYYAEKDGERESYAGSMPRAEPHTGFDFTTLRWWLSQNQESDTQPSELPSRPSVSLEYAFCLFFLVLTETGISHYLWY